MFLMKFIYNVIELTE